MFLLCVLISQGSSAALHPCGTRRCIKSSTLLAQYVCAPILSMSVFLLSFTLSLSQTVLTSELAKPLSELQTSKPCKSFQSKLICSWFSMVHVELAFSIKKIHLDHYLLKEQFVPNDLHSSKVKKEDFCSKVIFHKKTFSELFLS